MGQQSQYIPGDNYSESVSMKSHTLTSDWWTASDWIDFDHPVFTIVGDSCEMQWSVSEPAAATDGAPIDAGLYDMRAPLAGMQLYLRIPTGSATVYYTERDGIALDAAVIGVAYSGDAGSDEDFTATSEIAVGFDDYTTRSGANPYEFRGYLATAAANLDPADDLESALLIVRLRQWLPGRTLRLYGLEYAGSQSGAITDWDTLDNRTKTTAYAEVTLATSPIISFNVKAILEELQGVTGWVPESPIQFFIEDTGSAVTDADTRAIIDGISVDVRVAVLLTSGGGLPPYIEPVEGSSTWDWDTGINDWTINTDSCAVGFTATPPGRSGSAGEIAIPGTCE